MPIIGCQIAADIPSLLNPTPPNQAQTTQITSTLPELLATNEPVPSQTLPSPTTAVVVSDVTNTHWVGRIYEQDNNYIFEVFETIFLPDGKLRYHLLSNWYEDGTWQQKGNNIILQWENHACDLYGTMYGDTISGVGTQKCLGVGTGSEWSVKLQTP